jgi:hypothetical protein
MDLDLDKLYEEMDRETQEAMARGSRGSIPSSDDQEDEGRGETTEQQRKPPMPSDGDE